VADQENFIVKWTAQQGVTKPVVEAVMISTAFHQGISLISPGRIERGQSKFRERSYVQRKFSLLRLNSLGIWVPLLILEVTIVTISKSFPENQVWFIKTKCTLLSDS